MEYKCECCKFSTKKKYNYDKHILTNKHMLMEGKILVNPKTTESQHLVNNKSTISQPITPPNQAIHFECKICIF